MSRRVWWLAVVLVVGGAGMREARGQSPAPAASADEQGAKPAWEQAIERRRKELIEQNGPGTDAALRTELLAMRDRDQEARGFRNGAPTDREKVTMASNLREIDAALTERLKAIVQSNGWPTIGLVGIEASDGAALLLNHSPDHKWQREQLPQLTALADRGKIDGSQLASVIDKELVSEGKAQRYGTQFKFVDGEMRMFAVEDPGGLDALRARTLLPPMDAYRHLMERIYHLRVSNKVVSPGATN